MGKNKFLLFGLGGLVVVGLLFFSFSRFWGNNSPSNSVTNLPTYRLTRGEERAISALVESFVTLYNTYSLNSYENIYSIAVYMTPDMYDRVPGRLREIESGLGPGETVTAQVDPASFTYIRPSDGLLETNIGFDLIKTTGQSVVAQKSQANVTLKQDAVNDNWLIDKITITKK
jgi:hypothetical protein